MIKSMTGYGRAKKSLNNREITVEIKSVNHRYLDCTVKSPRVYGFLEEAIKSFVSNNISRGKVDVFVQIDTSQTNDTKITLNTKILEGYINTLNEISQKYNIENDMTTSSLSRFPEIFVSERQEADAKELTADVLDVLQSALTDYNGMRNHEGEKLYEDLIARKNVILGYVEQIEKRSPETVNTYRKKLYDRMCEILASTDIEESRILTEAAIFSDKVAVDEETVRMRSHLSQFEIMLSEEKAVGRKLDFLIQEFNREANTIGSKANDIEISKIVVNFKAEIEKIREQVQNIE